jgi:prepilin-type N-terminal cleavage/methylation domain-containing protein
MKRRAFTLVELLVVIGIIAALAILVLVFYPSRSNRSTTDGASQLQTYIASAKSRAMRDRSPRGIRLLDDGNGNFREFQFVEVPEPYAPLTPIQAVAGSKIIYVQYDLTSAILPGDLFEIVGESTPHRVTGPVIPAGPNVPFMGATDWYQFPVASAPTINASDPNVYRFIRQPRPLLGETTLHLPKGVLIDASQSLPSPLPTSFSGNTEIIFSQSGATIGGNNGRIVLWLRHDDNNAPPQLVTIYTRTGAVAVHPVAAGANPYANTQDGKSSGQ